MVYNSFDDTSVQRIEVFDMFKLSIFFQISRPNRYVVIII